MLISYPLLPATQLNATEEAKLTYMLGRTRNDEGIYPVSFGNRWHGGIHIEPENPDEPFRAIADGVVVAYRVAADVETYPPGQDSFDSSFVLIKHTTKSAENTDVVFYSLYMHLRSRGRLTQAQIAQLPAFLCNAAPSQNAVQAPANTRIYRKDVLGFAGLLYNQTRVHFEIFATETDFKGTPAASGQPARTGFWRDRTAISTGANGTTDIFGDIHFIIPANRDFTARHPGAVQPHRIDLPGRGNFYEMDVGQAGQNADALHVVVNFTRGTRTAKTYRILADGRREALGAAITQDRYEYELFRLATALYADCPSVGYEYLRFGRILGPGTTATNQNWQLVRYADNSIGYIDLAAQTHQVSVLSDADFPLYWQLLDEGQAANAADGICDVQALLDLIGHPTDTNNDGLVNKSEFAQHAARVDIAEQLRFLICKHPSEWSSEDLVARYGALQAASMPLHESEDWDQFAAHVNRMAFWQQTGITDRSVWHFHPLQFIKNYRASCWLTLEEISQLMPRRHGLNQRQMGAITWNTATSRFQNYLTDLNKTLRKYTITSQKRVTHFLAQTYIETAIWATMREFGRANQQRRDNGQLYWPAPAMEYYRAFYGRGIMQLTWAGNYDAYGSYRNFPDAPAGHTYQDHRITHTSQHYWEDPRDRQGNVVGQPRQWSPRYEPEEIANNIYNACDSGGFYWASKNTGNGNVNINQVCDQGVTPTEVARVSVLVNGGGYGANERQQYAAFIHRFMSDTTETTATGSIVSPGARGGNVHVDFTAQRP